MLGRASTPASRFVAVCRLYTFARYGHASLQQSIPEYATATGRIYDVIVSILGAVCPIAAGGTIGGACRVPLVAAAHCRNILVNVSAAVLIDRRISIIFGSRVLWWCGDNRNSLRPLRRTLWPDQWWLHVPWVTSGRNQIIDQCNVYRRRHDDAAGRHDEAQRRVSASLCPHASSIVPAMLLG